MSSHSIVPRAAGGRAFHPPAVAIHTTLGTMAAESPQLLSMVATSNYPSDVNAERYDQGSFHAFRLPPSSPLSLSPLHGHKRDAYEAQDEPAFDFAQFVASDESDCSPEPDFVRSRSPSLGTPRWQLGRAQKKIKVEAQLEQVPDSEEDAEGEDDPEYMQVPQAACVPPKPTTGSAGSSTRKVSESLDKVDPALLVFIEKIPKVSKDYVSLHR